MQHNNLLVEACQIVSAIVPVNLATAANNGDWVSLKNFDRVTIVVFKGAGTAGEDPVITLQQATAVAGTGAKALNFTRIDKKIGTQTGIGAFTTATQAAANTHTDADSAEAEGLFAIEVQASDLDVSNGYDCVQVSIPDAGTNAQIGCALYILRNARFAGAGLPSAIVD
ncbi:hypothetical protein [Phenylobacterium sp.]|uniref:hypothetical protein n=1 Tax=Phenylobacterium sp. TaxID=1871053 RepID=UPI00301E0947